MLKLNNQSECGTILPESCLCVRPDMAQQEIHRMVIERAEALLTEGETMEKDDNGHYDTYTCDGDDGGSKRYYYFSAPWYANELRKFITAPMLSDLQSGAHLLSVGSGPAHLERVLHRGFNIQNITLSDLDLHPRALSSGLPSHQFDMMKEWPKFDRGFDYIIFPESFGVSFLPIRRALMAAGRDVMDISEDGEITFAESEAMYTTLSSAVHALNPGGKIMITPGLYDHERKHLMPRLRDHVPSAIFEEGHHYDLIQRESS